MSDMAATMPQTLKNFIIEQSGRLSERSIDSPKLSAEVLVCKVLNITRQELLKKILLDPMSALDPSETRRVMELMARRLQGEPTAYITGEKEFYGRDFIVDSATLIPRPETEMLVDAAIAFVRSLEGRKAEARRREHPDSRKTRQDEQGTGLACVAASAPQAYPPGRFADFGAGSGCLAVTLAAELPGWKGCALDISPRALLTARKNARKHHVAGQLLFCRSDFRQVCLPEDSLDFIVANPPYISEDEFRGLSPEVKNFEPSSALLSDEDGLALPRAVISEAARVLKPGGLLLMEFGHAQGCRIDNYIKSSEFFDGHIVKDLAQLDRMLFAVKKPQTVKKQQI